MAITYNGFNLNDGTNYVTRVIGKGRGSAERTLDIAEVAVREGVKFLSEEYRQRTVRMSGTVFADSASEFRSRIDALKQTLAEVEKQLVIDDTGRYFIATPRQVDISDEGADITSASFIVDFICELPFALGAQQSVSYTATSGESSFDLTVSITGTAPARPTITYNIPDGDGSGNTTISGLTVEHPKGTSVTWSGTAGSVPLTYSGTLAFNYNNNSVTVRGSEEGFEGFFSTWASGTNAFTITFSGMSPGGTFDFSYDPRFY